MPSSPLFEPTSQAQLADALSRIALGDRGALASLYRLTGAHLLGVVLRITGDRGQAEDIVQDIFVSIWRTASGFEAGRSQPMTWLTSIARHRAIDSLRRRKTDPAAPGSPASAAQADGDDPLEALPDPQPGPLDLLQRGAEARALNRCVEKLSAEQQQSLALSYYQGLSHAEVAEHLGQPLGTVKSWVRRALIALKDCLTRAASAH